MQFTPDLLPADITGSFLYNQQEGTFEFRRGPLFTGLLLADEINRTPPKTQSALLEAMQERQATVEGETFPLPDPFHVLATANPIEYEGTYPLPEAQLDRFLMRVSFGYPTADEEYDVVQRRLERASRRRSTCARSPTRAGLRAMQAAVETVTVDEHRRALLRRARHRDPRPQGRAHRVLAARLARAGAGGARLRGRPRPRLRDPRGRQGRRPRRAVPPDHGQARALDDPGQRPAGRRRRARLGADARAPWRASSDDRAGAPSARARPWPARRPGWASRWRSPWAARRRSCWSLRCS